MGKDLTSLYLNLELIRLKSDILPQCNRPTTAHFLLLQGLRSIPKKGLESMF